MNFFQIIKFDFYKLSKDENVNIKKIKLENKNDDKEYNENVVLEIDYWVLIPKKK